MSDQFQTSSGSPQTLQPPPLVTSPQPVGATAGQVTLGNGQLRTLASPGKRLGARLIDGVILGAGALIVLTLGIGGGAVLGSIGSDAAAAAGVAAFFMTVLVVVALAIAYEVTLTALKGQTLGKMVLGIRVERADVGGVPGWGKAAIRWVIPAAGGLVPFVGPLVTLLVYVSLLWDDRRQGWHDMVAGTVVVN